MSDFEGRREVIKVTQWRNGCVYRTKYVCDVWIDIDASEEEILEIAKKHGGDFLGTPRGYGFDDLRKKKR